MIVQLLFAKKKHFGRKLEEVSNTTDAWTDGHYYMLHEQSKEN